MTYTINAHNGFIEEIEVATLREAKEYADKVAAYTQENLSIDVDGKPVAIRRWWGVAPDEEAGGDIISFGDFGFYSEWEDCTE